MDRRDFLKMLGMAAAAAASGQLPLFAKNQPQELKHWVWIGLTPDRSADEWKRSFSIMRNSGVRAILPEIYNGSFAYFPSRQVPVSDDRLGTILPLAKAAGLEVHAWMWCMPCFVPEIMQKHPDWYNVNALGESALEKPAYNQHYRVLDPARSEVREWVQGIVRELAGIPDLAGIHLDYIRHPDAILPSGMWKQNNVVQDKVYPQYDYGYTEIARRQFKKKYGLDPMQIHEPEQNRQWVQFRCDSVTELVNHYLVPAAHAAGKAITAAVFPGPTLARQMVRQDWGRWHLDAFLPMLYNSFYEAGPEWVEQQTREGALAVKKPVYSGLFVHNMDRAMFEATTGAALAGGAHGISVFSLSGMDDSKWEALRTITTRKRPLTSGAFARDRLQTFTRLS